MDKTFWKFLEKCCTRTKCYYSSPMTSMTSGSALARPSAGSEPFFDRVASPGVGVADLHLRPGDGSFCDVLMHRGGGDTSHAGNRLHVDEVLQVYETGRLGLRWGRRCVFHDAQCAPPRRSLGVMSCRRRQQTTRRSTRGVPIRATMPTVAVRVPIPASQRRPSRRKVPGIPGESGHQLACVGHSLRIMGRGGERTGSD